MKEAEFRQKEHQYASSRKVLGVHLLAGDTQNTELYLRCLQSNLQHNLNMYWNRTACITMLNPAQA